MRICLITEYFYPENSGGTPTVLSDLMRYLKDHYSDCDIEVITGRNPYRQKNLKLDAYENWDGIRIHRLKVPRSNRPSSLLRLMAGFLFALAATVKVLRFRRFDVVFVGTNPPSAPLAAMLNKYLKGTPYVYLVDDLYPDLMLTLGLLSVNDVSTRIARRFQRGWLSSANRVIALGRCMRDNLARTYRISQDRITVIPRWGNPDRVYPCAANSSFRNNNQLTGFVALYAGNIGSLQGLDTIIDAAKILEQKCPDVTLAMVGMGCKKEDLEHRIQTENISNLRLYPAVSRDDYPDMLASADVLLLPLAKGVSGLAVPSKLYDLLEVGRPIIAILDSMSEVAQVVLESGSGLQVNQGDSEVLADGIVRLKNDPQLAKQMGENARNELSRKYTIGHIAQIYHQTYLDVISEGSMRVNASVFPDDSRRVSGEHSLERSVDPADLSRPLDHGDDRKSVRQVPIYHLLKRILDCSFASMLLLLLTPLFAIIVVLIQLDSPGKALYTQQRVGRRGKLFTIYKFRTMETGAPVLSTAQMQENKHIPITRLGRLLRMTNLDELPQLINILKGEMSFIGPRPALPSQTDVNTLREELGADSALPGITGLAQVMGRDDLDTDTKVMYDARYYKRMSLWFDLKILLLTIAAVLSCRGNK